MSEEKKDVVVPTLGRIVLYKLTQEDADAINKRRTDVSKNLDKIKEDSIGYQAHVGNSVSADQVVSATVVCCHQGHLINIKCALDGTDDYWATSIDNGPDAGQWDWMDYQKGQAKKNEELEKELEK